MPRGLPGGAWAVLELTGTLTLLCRLSYEAGQRKSGTILGDVLNRGEEKVMVHMNVVPRSTMNTNGGTGN